MLCKRCGEEGAKRKYCGGCAIEARREYMERYEQEREPYGYARWSEKRKLACKERSKRRSLGVQKEISRWEDDGGYVRYEFGRKAARVALQKRCSRCKQVRPIGWFFRKDRGRLASECKECARPGNALRQGVRRARLKANGWERIGAEEIRYLGERQGWVCACGCGVSVRWSYHVDHKKALSRGGSHVLSNLQLLTPGCNLRKGAR